MKTADQRAHAALGHPCGYQIATPESRRTDGRSIPKDRAKTLPSRSLIAAATASDGNVIIKVEVACNEVWVGGRFERDNLLHIESSPMLRSNVNDKAVRVILTCQHGNL